MNDKVEITYESATVRVIRHKVGNYKCWLCVRKSDGTPLQPPFMYKEDALNYAKNHTQWAKMWEENEPEESEETAQRGA